jgi:hypothetical protein
MGAVGKRLNRCRAPMAVCRRMVIDGAAGSAVERSIADFPGRIWPIACLTRNFGDLYVLGPVERPKTAEKLDFD